MGIVPNCKIATYAWFLYTGSHFIKTFLGIFFSLHIAERHFCHVLAAHIQFWPINDSKTHFKSHKPTMTKAVSMPSAPFSRNGHSTTTLL